MVEFPFFLKLAVSPESPAVLHDLAASVFEQLGFPGGEAIAILREFDTGLHAAGADACASCEVEFRADQRNLLIVVSVAGGADWRLTRRLPSAD